MNFDEPPAKLLQRLYRDKLSRDYKKVTHGTNLFRDADPNVVAAKCPYLQQMLDEMLKLAKQAGC